MRFAPNHPQRLLIRTIEILVLALSVVARGQTFPDNGAAAGFGSVNTPRPINPASDTTNPSARATQNLNPYLGSKPNGEATNEELHLSLDEAISR